MTDKMTAEPETVAARDWMRALSKYREPQLGRGLFEVAVTIIPFIGLWAAALWAVEHNVWLALAFTIPIAAFLVRIFLIQHDCGHGAFFASRKANNWVGRIFGVLTLTPYEMWKHSHAIHHSGAGNLDKRGVGDILTLTVAEYKQRNWFGRLKYRAYRHPITLFVIGPIYIYIFQNRLPIGFMDSGWRFWGSTMGTNVALTFLLAAIWYFFGWEAIVFVYLPSSVLGAAIGIWLFYVQHQFEETHWDDDQDWQLHESALHGSSHYDLPPVLRWLSANIGIHHVHHLYSRIPFYRLSQVLRDHPALSDIGRITLWESFACVKLQLWDETQRRLVTYREALA